MPPVASQLDFGILGPVAAWRDGNAVALGAPQQRVVLALLLLHRGAVVSTDRLIDVLWPAGPPRHALQDVRTHVFRLRRRLGADAPLRTRPGGYAVDLAPGALDADRLASLASAGRAALAGGEAAAAETLLREALGLVRGTPLPELAEDLAAGGERHRLEELQAAAAEDLREALLVQERHRELVPALRAAVAEHPLRERGWGQLMVALYRSGRQAEALAAYKSARATLRREVGLEPGPALRELERAVLHQDHALVAGAGGPARIPRYRTSLVGRIEDIAAVAEVLRDARLVTLVGPAGAGKTRLAVESAASLDDRAEAVPCWVDLGSVERGQVVAAVARALAIPDVAGRAAADSILARLGEARTLLVLDNCEHVLDEAAGLAARVLEHAPATRILATSREALRIAGEVVRDVGGLPGREAARLFAERIPEGAGALAGPGDAAAIECIVARLDGLPLAIELAAAKLRALSVGELAQELGDRLSLLDAGDRSAPRRQRTLRTAIDWSAELISDRDRLVLQRISVFPGSFDAHSAAAVAGAEPLSAGEVLPALARLVEASLLAAERRPAGTRYRLLQTVRAYARERAAAAGELAGAARRHRDAYTAWAEELFRHCNGSGVAAWLPRGREEYPNLLAALRWSLEHGEGDAALQLASALTRFWWRTGLAGAGLRLLDEALELAGHGGPWASRALVYRAMLTRAAGTPDAGAAARDAVAVAARQPDPMLRWTAAFMEVQERLDAGDVPAARAAAGRIGLAASEAGDEEGLLVADQALGAVLLRAGDLDAAAEVLIRARDGMRRLRGTLDAGWILIDLADVRLAQGRTRDALESARLAQGDFRRRGDPRGVAAALVRAGRAHSASGDPDSARKALAEAAAIAERWGYPALRAEAAAAAPAAAVR